MPPREEPITSDVVVAAPPTTTTTTGGAVLMRTMQLPWPRTRHENEIYVSHVINFKRGVASLK